MNPMLMTAIAVSVAGAIAFLATAPAGPGRSLERRRRYVSRHPGLVNLGDVERRLAAELPTHHHDFVLARIARQKIDAHTLWAWLDRFDAETLVLALAADSGYAGLLRRLRNDDLDRTELEVFAGFNHPELFALRNRTFV